MNWRKELKKIRCGIAWDGRLGAAMAVRQDTYRGFMVVVPRLGQNYINSPQFAILCSSALKLSKDQNLAIQCYFNVIKSKYFQFNYKISTNTC